MENSRRPVPTVVIKRLPRYYRYLSDYRAQGVTRISSGVLSKKMNVTASQIRQDFNYFGGFGQQGYGYNVDYLHNEIGAVLGLHEHYTAVIIGAGHLGHALAMHSAFERRGFKVMALFDTDPKKIGTTINGHPVYDCKDMEQYVRDNNIKIGILTLPKNATVSVAEQLIDAGVEGLWNFSYIELKTNKPVVIENVHLSDSLMTLSYKMKAASIDTEEN